MSRLPRFFISSDQVTGPSVVITHEDVRHIATVLRMKTGEELLLCDGQGTEYTVKIVEIGKLQIRTEIVGKSKRDVRPPRVTLGQGLPKSDKMDLIVQKATELGVASIVPLDTERTIVKLKDEEKRIARWQKIAREAAMQSNRIDIPKIEQVQKFSDFFESLSNLPLEKREGGFSTIDSLFIIPWEEGTEPLKNILRQNPDVKNIVVLIGPEGGFSAKEAELAKEKGFHLVTLGPNILRTETAAVAVLSMIGYEYF